MTQRSQRGFTLIEIMIVISIVSVVASFALPAIEDSRRAAKETSAIAMIRSVYSAQQRFKNLEKVPSIPNTTGFGYHLQDVEDAGLLPVGLERVTTTEYTYGGYAYVSFGGLNHPIAELQQLVIFVTPQARDVGNRSFLMTQDGRLYYRDDGATFLFADMGEPFGEKRAVATDGDGTVKETDPVAIQ
ncbi:MAG: type II secretion system protein [Planctomycetota bacterium]|jgi:prepilin-type N-terminal cleavage/methylation domain-containing protein